MKQKLDLLPTNVSGTYGSDHDYHECKDPVGHNAEGDTPRSCSQVRDLRRVEEGNGQESLRVEGVENEETNDSKYSHGEGGRSLALSDVPNRAGKDSHSASLSRCAQKQQFAAAKTFNGPHWDCCRE